MKRIMSNLRKEDVRCVKSADRWLRQGKPLEALQTLDRLPNRAWNHPLTERVVWRAAQAVDCLASGAGEPGGRLPVRAAMVW